MPNFQQCVTEHGKCEHESWLCEVLKIFIARGPNFHQIEHHESHRSDHRVKFIKNETRANCLYFHALNRTAFFLIVGEITNLIDSITE